MPTNNAGKASPGSRFKPPPAVIWNNMVDAGRAWADAQLSSPGGSSVRPRDTDLIKIKNNSGATRRLGEILKIEGKAIETLSNEHIWLLGIEPTTDCHFGILKSPFNVSGVGDFQCSGCCMALVNVTDTNHKRARAIDEEYVLQSDFDGPIEILYASSGTGEKTCAVRFTAAGVCVTGKLDGALAAAVAFADDPGTATMSVWLKDSAGDMVDSTSNIPVKNRLLYISLSAGTIVEAKVIDREWRCIFVTPTAAADEHQTASQSAT